ncbi:RICIN domain-containing protein [Enorma phocaeensis]|uniref:RICIN domain-containing protein n=1 Tax=Enorma phocaeensis TaxID=1871019 RepID=UPI000C85217D|nr:RICIN domain-containing protein [Enorma phocaeensis]
MKLNNESPSLGILRPFFFVFVLLAMGAALLSTVAPRNACAEELVSIEDGVYVIKSGVGDGKVLDISEADTSNGVNVQIFEDTGSLGQYWRIEAQGEHYRIVNSMTGISLDVYAALQASGTNVQVFQWNGSEAQLWDFIMSDDGSVSIRSVCNGLVLDVYAGLDANGTNVQVFESNGSAAQRWTLSPVTQTIPDGLYRISSALDIDLVFDVPAAARSNSVGIQLWNSNSSLAQTWKLSFDEETGFYTIVSAVSGRSLDVPAGIGANGTLLQQFDQNNSAAQCWSIVGDDESGYAIRSALGFTIDVPSAIADSGVKIQLWESNGSTAQKWIISETNIDISGLYLLASSLDEGMVLDVSAASKEENARIQIWSSNGTLAQKWQVSKQDDGSYEIRNANSGLYLSDNGGTQLVSLNQAESDEASWLVSVGRGGLMFINKSTGRALDLSAACTEEGTSVGPFNMNGTEAQSWILLSTTLIEEGCYILFNNSGSSQALDVPAATTEDSIALQTYESNNTSAQKWIVESTGDGWYEITNVNSGLALDVRNGSAQPGNAVQQYASNNSAAQRWSFEIAPGGGIQIKSKLGNYAVTVDAETAVSGSQVVIDAPRESSTYSWTFVETSYIQEVDDIWGDSSYINQMRSIAQRQGSRTNWIAIADKSRNRCTVFYYTGGEWVLANSMDVLTSGNTFTGSHEVYIRARGYWKEPDCYDVNDWYIGFVEDWWSSPSSSHMRYVEGMGYDEGQGFHYGFAGSGCICIPDYEKSLWLYNNIEIGSTVYIF